MAFRRWFGCRSRGSRLLIYKHVSILKTVCQGYQNKQTFKTRCDDFDLQKSLLTGDVHNSKETFCQWVQSKGEEHSRFMEMCNMEQCQTILVWKLLVNLVEDSANELSTNHSNGFPELSCVCVCACLCVTVMIEVWNTSTFLQWKVWIGLFFVYHALLKTYKHLSFQWLPKGIGAMTHQANSIVCGGFGPL